MEHHVTAGSNVITQGEKARRSRRPPPAPAPRPPPPPTEGAVWGAQGNHFYVVCNGELDAFVKPPGSEEEARHVKAFGPGNMFGELALMYNCPRTPRGAVARTDVPPRDTAGRSVAPHLRLSRAAAAARRRRHRDHPGAHRRDAVVAGPRLVPADRARGEHGQGGGLRDDPRARAAARAAEQRPAQPDGRRAPIGGLEPRGEQASA